MNGMSFQSAQRFPSSHHREEGWPSEEEIARSNRFREDRVVYRLKRKENHPVCAELRMLRDIC
jgi:hypothetical protein